MISDSERGKSGEALDILAGVVASVNAAKARRKNAADNDLMTAAGSDGQRWFEPGGRVEVMTAQGDWLPAVVTTEWRVGYKFPVYGVQVDGQATPTSWPARNVRGVL